MKCSYGSQITIKYLSLNCDSFPLLYVVFFAFQGVCSIIQHWQRYKMSVFLYCMLLAVFKRCHRIFSYNTTFPSMHCTQTALLLCNSVVQFCFCCPPRLVAKDVNFGLFACFHETTKSSGGRNKILANLIFFSVNG